jgi:sensor histidine kinase YesM
METARTKVIGIHLLVWSLFFVLILAFVTNFTGEAPFRHLLAFPFWIFVAVFVSLFYFHERVLIPKFYLQRRYAIYFAIALFLFISFFFLKPFDRLLVHGHEFAGPQFKPTGPPTPPNLPRPPAHRNPGRPQLDILSMILFVAVWAASSVMQLLRQWRITERRAIQAEADKTSAELSFLKAQINPHFLFNTLNNIYSLTLIKSDHAPMAVLKLSGILRYITDEAGQDFVPLQSEVECANNFIDLQKLRLNKKVIIDFLVTGAVEGKKIAPLLFMTFIENAFKYGVSNHESCLIIIHIEVDDHKINFLCQNRIVRSEDEERTGVGITNAKKRLAFLYPQKHLLQIRTEEDQFIVDLAITM